MTPSFLSGGAGMALLVLLVLIAGTLVVCAFTLAGKRAPSHLDRMLAPYSEEADEFEPEDERVRRNLLNTDLLQKAVATASRLAVGRRVVVWLEHRLEQAAVPLRAVEALGAYGVAATVASVLTLLFVGPILALGVAAGLTALPLAFLSMKAKLRRKKFTHQLPDALKLLSGTLRAGFSLSQGITTMADEVGEPMSTELGHVIAEARLGRPLEDALADMAVRLESKDFEWTVMAIGIQREVGGNLAELLDTVSETMVARQRLRGEVSALTAEGRISAAIIGFMPPALGLFMWVVNRAYISVLFSNQVGQMMAVAAALWAAFGFWWMRKTIAIEV